MDTYGNWTVEDTFIKNQKTYAHVTCTCGNKAEVAMTNLKSGRSTRCRQCSYKSRGPLYAKRVHGNLLAANDKYHDYKRSAKKRGISFNLSFEKFLDLTSRDCFFCDRPPSNVNRLPQEWADDFVYNGIDRWDNSDGYSEDNCVPCCKICNYSKRDLGANEFIENCWKVAEKFQRDEFVVLLKKGK